MLALRNGRQKRKYTPDFCFTSLGMVAVVLSLNWKFRGVGDGPFR